MMIMAAKPQTKINLSKFRLSSEWVNELNLIHQKFIAMYIVRYLNVTLKTDTRPTSTALGLIWLT